MNPLKSIRTAILLGLLLVSGAAGAQDAYLFSYFDTKFQSAGLLLAYSYDGYHWTALNDNKPVMKPEVGSRLMRDPSICQGPDGTFHMVWTTGWTDKVIGYASSKDLVHWSEQREIPVMEWSETARNSWAPELYYDSRSHKFYILWASTVPGAEGISTDGCISESGYNHRIWYTTTKDFKKFSKTALYFNPDFNAIDAAVIKDPSDNSLIMVVKNENLTPEQKNIRVTRAKSMKKGFSTEVSEPIHAKFRAEGPSPIFIGDDLVVFYDMYSFHRFGASLSRDHGRTWTDITDKISMPAGMSHGTAFKVDRSVVDNLIASYK